MTNCLECKKEIHDTSIRCRSCSAKHNIRIYGHPKGMLNHKFSEETILKFKNRTGSKNSFYGKKHTAKTKARMIKTLLSQWKLIPRHRKNKLESRFELFLNDIIPSEYKYTGDYTVNIERYSPDFINVNGQKKIIEVYGDYWHNLPGYKERDKRRIKTYKKYGYKTLVVWEHELQNLTILKEKLLNFNKEVGV